MAADAPPFPPIDPGLTPWALAEHEPSPGEDLVAVGADLDPATLLAAYRAGLFPMGLGRHGRPPIGWFAPTVRGVLRPGGFHVSRSLRRSARRYEVSVDQDLRGVMAGCGDPARTGRWITPQISAAYERLHDLGWVHSVEVWKPGERGPDALLGGVYGVAIGGLFAGESMFHRATDASKVALLALVERVFADGDPRRVFDVQWSTPHLASLGVVELPREEYRAVLAEALHAPDIDFSIPPDGVATIAEP